MMLKLVLEDGWEIPLNIRDDIGREISAVIPMVSRLEKWKEEIYFETELQLEVERLVNRVERGDFAYWPPGRALCLFYGISQPYTPVEIIGEALGSLDFLSDIESGTIVRLETYEDYNEVKEICEILRGLGYKAASRKDDEGVISIALNIYYGNERVGVDLFPEEYGIYVESDSLAKYERTVPERVAVRKMRKLIKDTSGNIRLDLNERDMLCLSACCKSLRELPELLNEFKRCIEVLKDYI